MQTWIYFVHPPREDFVRTITEDEAAIMAADRAITSGLMTGELRPMRIAFLRGRD
jgi:hypothetical protein